MRSSVFRRIIVVLCLAALPLAILPSVSRAQISVGVSINLAPPALPVYVQPEVPAPGYIWAPGYWAWGPYGYYWVPGTWVAPPEPGLLWTPGYWGWSGGNYIWYPGYWGTQVGFYGGVNYGFGYSGHGYWGGEWRGGTFVYNSAVTNVTNVNVTNVYNRTVINQTVVNHVSFNGGPGGVVAQPTHSEAVFAQQHHVAPTPMQQEHVRMAQENPQLRASANGGRPAIAATARPGVFSGHGVIAARAAGGPVHAAPIHTAERPAGGERPGGSAAFNEHRNGAPPHPQEQFHAAARPEEHAPAPRAPQPEQRAPQQREAHANPHASREPARPQKDDKDHPR
jgi:hypothetical protein